MRKNGFLAACVSMMLSGCMCCRPGYNDCVVDLAPIAEMAIAAMEKQAAETCLAQAKQRELQQEVVSK